MNDNISNVKFWMARIWEQKNKIFSAIAALTSISVVHYAGFVTSLPSEVISAAGPYLIIGATKPFLIYSILVYGISKAIISGFQLILPPISLTLDRLAIRKMRPTPKDGRKFVRSQINYTKAEKYALLVFQLALGVPILFAIYVNLTITAKTIAWTMVWLTLITIIILYRSGYFNQAKKSDYLKRINSRSSHRMRLALITISTITSSFVVLAYIAGYERMSYLKDLPDRQISTSFFTGNAKYIAGTDEMLLTLEKKENNYHYQLYFPMYAIGLTKKEDDSTPTNK